MRSVDAEACSAHSGADTRQRLLTAAAREIHVHGFQAASLSRILAKTGVTKGALYHHFGSKLALGYAVLDERYAPEMRRRWIEPLSGDVVDPLGTLINIIHVTGHEMKKSDVLLGCPINNLAQEMSPVDEGFRQGIETLFDEWRSVIQAALRRAQSTGTVAAMLDTEATAAFIVASMEGCTGMAKNAQSKDILMKCGEGLVSYLQSLRGEPGKDTVARDD